MSESLSLTDRTIAAGREALGRPATGLARLPAVRWPRSDRLDRLHGPRQLRHQHPGWGAVRLSAAVGRSARQPGRHAVPGALRQTGDRHRPQPRTALPHAFPPPAGLHHVGRQRGRRDGDRPRRISRRRHWPQSAVRPSAADRPADHLCGDLRLAAAAGPGLSATRDGHSGVHRGDCRLLRDRAVRCPAQLVPLHLPYGRATACRPRQRCAGGGHHRRDRHAARDLPALQPHAGPRARYAPTPSAAASSATRIARC